MRRGKLITIEGPEGSGKSTLAELLVNELVANGVPTLKSKEPGTAFEGKLRSIILGDKPAPVAELFLFLADRAEHIAKYVEPTLEQGIWVVLDRFSDSTVIYQAIAKQVVDPEICRRLCDIAEQGVKVDRTLLLQADFDVCQARLATRSDQIKRVAQQGGLDLEWRIWSAYMELAELYPRVQSINTNRVNPNEALSMALEKLHDLMRAYDAQKG